MDASREGVGGSGNASQSSWRSNHKHKCTAEQIERLERMFNECTHPDEDMRMQLSRELGLLPRQIQFWFQNRRTQLKAQQAKAGTFALRVENDNIKREIIAMKEALEHKVCASCRCPATCINEQVLRIENAQLKEERHRVSSEIVKYTGRPISQLHLGNQGIVNGPSLDFLSSDCPAIHMWPFGFTVTDFDMAYMTYIASNAMVELKWLLEINTPIWINSSSHGRQVINRKAYEKKFPRATKNPNVRAESSKDSSIVSMNSVALVEIFMDVNKWMEVFPTIVSKAETIKVITTGPMDSRNGWLQLMYEEIQVMSPLVPTRKFYFLRFCQKVEQNTWAIADVSYDNLREYCDSECRARRLPSGCYIEDMLNGQSKVTWMEHTQIEDRKPIHNFYREHTCSGLAFGAERSLTTLQRMCERFTYQMDSGTFFLDLEGVNQSPHGKRYLMKLSQRMVSNFCSSINPVDGQQWMISEINDFKVRTTLKNCTNPGHPTSRVLSAVTTIWLPFAPQKIFDFLRNKNTRHQWDVISDNNYVEEVGRIASGSHSGNCISILRAFSTSLDSKLILQESCIDSSGALVVYCPVNLATIKIAMSGEDPCFIPLLSSGFVISPDGKTSGEMSGGALVTIVLQTYESNATLGTISQESANTLNNFLEITINQIKAALN